MEIQELLTKYSLGYDLLIKQLNQMPDEAILFKPSHNQWSIMRKSLHKVLKLITPDTWHNYIFHPETGKITLMDWIQLYIDHIDIHIQQMHRNFYDWKKFIEKEIV